MSAENHMIRADPTRRVISGDDIPPIMPPRLPSAVRSAARDGLTFRTRIRKSIFREICMAINRFPIAA
jgi:hypothetical protein